MNAFIPASAAKPASDEAALPVEEQVISFRPSHRARVTPTELARSLKEAVGLRPSSLTKKAPRPSSFASAGASTTGVKPTWRRGGTTSSGSGRRAR